MTMVIKIKSSLYLPACYEWRGSSPRPSAWAAHLRKYSTSRRDVVYPVSDVTGPIIELMTFRTANKIVKHHVNQPISPHYPGAQRFKIISSIARALESRKCHHDASCFELGMCRVESVSKHSAE